jgi:hypothetical protein
MNCVWKLKGFAAAGAGRLEAEGSPSLAPVSSAMVKANVGVGGCKCVDRGRSDGEVGGWRVAPDGSDEGVVAPKRLLVTSGGSFQFVSDDMSGTTIEGGLLLLSAAGVAVVVIIGTSTLWPGAME